MARTDRPHSPRSALSPETLAVAAGRPPRAPDAPLNVPLTPASTYVAGGALEYGRFGNPTWQAFEDAVGALEGGRAVMYASGLAAAAATFSLVPDGGAVVVPRHAYNGTLGLLRDGERRGRLTVREVDVTHPDALVDAAEGAAMVWIESPTNPALEVVDIAETAAAARTRGALVVVDNTFATPLVQQPLALGADVVVHSATKLLAGHSDALAGVAVVADDATYDLLEAYRRLHGATPGTLEAYLATRGLRTLAVRFERAQDNARRLVERLEADEAVATVGYPGFGTVLTFEPVGGAVAAHRVTTASELVVCATSLGGVETTWERRRRWAGEPETIPDALIRVSVGIEGFADLWADVAQALDPSSADLGLRRT
ncbi:PLP-dependent transferase [Mumia sp. ZJ1417]|uniref:trans-sulfuration enzyme family protein n=1 Tax=Mumia sp. ZJ1417 TaxID=2708082 RepID=UPI001422F5EE|nr:PLP-dependent transferase [Mumia sp. ZJ1417]QMW67618.1 PLP-dependent transferase [Mumia sp. ZJ1417]